MIKGILKMTQNNFQKPMKLYLPMKLNFGRVISNFDYKIQKCNFCLILSIKNNSI